MDVFYETEERTIFYKIELKTRRIIFKGMVSERMSIEIKNYTIIYSRMSFRHHDVFTLALVGGLLKIKSKILKK